jgi:hypothetical protein
MQNPNDPRRPKDIGPDYGRSGSQGASATETGSTSRAGGSGAQSSSGGQAVSAQDIGDLARDAASSAADALKDGAKDLAAHGRDMLEDQKRSGAEYISGVAEALRRAAKEVEKDVPFAGSYIRTAGSQVDSLADAVRHGDLSDLAAQTQAFARRQPTLFVGLSMLAGFGVARLLKGAAPPLMSGASGSTGASSLGAMDDYRTRSGTGAAGARSTFGATPN